MQISKCSNVFSVYTNIRMLILHLVIIRNIYKGGHLLLRIIEIWISNQVNLPNLASFGNRFIYDHIRKNHFLYWFERFNLWYFFEAGGGNKQIFQIQFEYLHKFFSWKSVKLTHGVLLVFHWYFNLHLDRIVCYQYSISKSIWMFYQSIVIGLSKRNDKLCSRNSF